MACCVFNELGCMRQCTHPSAHGCDCVCLPSIGDQSRGATTSDRAPVCAATVTAVEGRKVTFAVTAKDEIDTISSGSHVRFVVDKAKTIERLRAKAAKLGSV